jgi:hypothetical protein
MDNPPASHGSGGKNRRWVVFFLLLAVLAAAGILVPVWVNLALQLKAQEVATAEALWHEHGPSDYDLEYRVKIDDDEPVDYRVAVRSWRVMWVTSPNGVVMSSELHDALGPVLGCALRFCYKDLAPADELTQLHSIDAFFTLMKSKLRDDVAVGGRNYATATFDTKDGHPLRYIHRVRGSRERVELNVRLLAPDELPGSR